MKKSIALIGFGEAGQHVAMGLHAAGDRALTTLTTYDIKFDQPDGDALKSKAVELGVTIAPGHGQAVEDAAVVFSFVVGSQAVAAAAACAPALRKGQVYIDCNSVSPGTKKDVGAALAGTGCTYVEAAVMAPVPPYLHRVPMLLAGAEANAVASTLTDIGFVADPAGDNIGDASLNKMLRSIMIKGIEALLFECLAVAQRYGIEERILKSVSETLPGLDWRALATYDLGRISIHGARRASEMKESAQTVRECGFNPIMAEAIARRIAEAHGLIGNVDWPNGEPKSCQEIFDVLNARLSQDLDPGGTAT